MTGETWKTPIIIHLVHFYRGTKFTKKRCGWRVTRKDCMLEVRPLHRSVDKNQAQGDSAIYFLSIEYYSIVNRPFNIMVVWVEELDR